MEIMEIELNDVRCDICGSDFTHDNTLSGGFIYATYAYCPKCAIKSEDRLKRCGEEKYITARCPVGISFADWIRREIRGNTPAKITVIGNTKFLHDTKIFFENHFKKKLHKTS
jgi:hypothetical protein